MTKKRFKKAYKRLYLNAQLIFFFKYVVKYMKITCKLTINISLPILRCQYIVVNNNLRIQIHSSDEAQYELYILEFYFAAKICC